MVKKFFHIAFAMSLLCILPLSYQFNEKYRNESVDHPDQNLHQKCLYPTVLVRPAGARSCGTGVIVRSTKFADGEYYNVFITCHHVATSYDKPYVVDFFEYENWSQLKKSTSYDVQWVHQDSDRDLAIGVFITPIQMPVAEIDFHPILYIGSDVFRIGCGLGDEPRLDYGKITSPKGSINRVKNSIRTSVHTLPGDSGSPVFHKYKVFGIMQAIRIFQYNYNNQPVFSMSYCITLDVLIDMNKEQCHSLEFVWTNQRMPCMPFWRLKFNSKYATEESKS